MELFIDEQKVTADLRRSLEGVASFRPYGEIEDALTSVAKEMVEKVTGSSDEGKAAFWIDPASCNAALADILKEYKDDDGESLKLVEKKLPVAGLKLLKSSAEVEQMKVSHRFDGAALCRFFHWLEKEVCYVNLLVLFVSI